MTVDNLYLSPSVSPQPLIHRYYAWPHMVSPQTAALNFSRRQLVVLDSYLDNPGVHDGAAANLGMFSGPFLDAAGFAPADLREFRDRFVKDAANLLALADDIAGATKMLHAQADGGPLTSLYDQLPASLRGCVELVYDECDQPSLRFLEPMLYRSASYERAAQQLSLLPAPDLAQPFIFNSPLLPDDRRVDLDLPFDAAVLDELFAARTRPVDVQDLAERLGVAEADSSRFAALFTSEVPTRPEPLAAASVRMRYFGHACVLLESADAAVLLDPMIGYAADGYEHFTWADLPDRLDAVVLSHAHCDHVSLEALLQLRHRVERVVVPSDSGGSLVDPGLAVMLRAMGFTVVDQLGELETRELGEGLRVTAVPFLGEHADLNIRSKMIPLIEMAGRRFLFATDTTLVAPELFARLGDLITDIDALFIGLECVGAPMSWLYGPLLEHRPKRQHDQNRRLNGSDGAMADSIATVTGARQVYAYAMGFEPWLRHLTGSYYDPESEQYRQIQLLLDRCAARSVPAELLHLRGERVW